MLDQTAAYRTSAATTSSGVGQVVLLYRAAIRFAMRHLAALEKRDAEAAHLASVRCQAIVAGLQEVLDLSAGPIAVQLDALYEFVLRRLVAGNLGKDPKPTEEAVGVLRQLLDAWEAVAQQQAGAPQAASLVAASVAVPSAPVPPEAAPVSGRLIGAA